MRIKCYCDVEEELEKMESPKLIRRELLKNLIRGARAGPFSHSFLREKQHFEVEVTSVEQPELINSFLLGTARS